MINQCIIYNIKSLNTQMSSLSLKSSTFTPKLMRWIKATALTEPLRPLQAHEVIHSVALRIQGIDWFSCWEETNLSDWSTDCMAPLTEVKHNWTVDIRHDRQLPEPEFFSFHKFPNWILETKTLFIIDVWVFFTDLQHDTALQLAWTGSPKLHSTKTCGGSESGTILPESVPFNKS